MNFTYFRIELVRQLRNGGNLVFVLGMPIVMYFIIASAQPNVDQQFGEGNVSFYVMASMAAYGAALGAASITGTAALEKVQGWGRQVGITPASGALIVATKSAVAMVVSGAAIALVFAAGALGSAQADTWSVWLWTGVIAFVGALPFALLGYAVASYFQSQSALGVVTGLIVIFSFLGNLFFPLSGTMLDIARWTPLYGYAGLMRWPQLSGELIDGTSDSFGLLATNMVAWTVVFACIAVLGVQRSRGRQ